MGKKDTITKEYMNNPVIFADAFNKFLYHGRQVIQPEKLVELDTASVAVPYGGGEAGVPEQKYRDVMKLMMTDGRLAYCILGIENQSGIHYAMPVRNMLYDALQLAHQVSETAGLHRKEHTNRPENAVSAENTADGEPGRLARTGEKPSPDEFLSGFYKTDRLLPVVTLVVFFGAGRWDGPLTLKEMYSAADGVVLEHVPDYKVNLIAPGQMSDGEMEEFQTSLKEVLLYNKYSEDKEKLQGIMQQDKNFGKLDRQAAEVINVTTNSNLKFPEGEEAVDMCRALREMVAEGEAAGEIRGKIKAFYEMGLPVDEIAERTGAPLDEVLKVTTEINIPDGE